MSITFALGPTTVALPDPAPACPVRAARRQVIGRAAGGAAYVYDKGVTTHEVLLTFESLTDTEKEALSAFFAVTAQGGRNVFTYTDSNGAARTARFLDPELRLVKLAPRVWDARVRLELSSMGT